MKGFLDALKEGASNEALWDAAFEEKFKEVFGGGVKDWRDGVEKDREVLRQMRERSEEVDAMRERMGKLPYELGEALRSYSDGGDYRSAIKAAMGKVSLSEEGSKLKEEDVVEGYYPGKFSEEDREAIKDGDAKMKGLWEEYVRMGREKHDAKRGEVMRRLQAEDASRKDHAKRSEEANASAIAYLNRNKGLSSFMDKAVVDDFVSGRLEQGLLYNEDGTRKPESLARLLAARHFEEIVAAIRAGAKVEARNEALHASHDKLPERPKEGGGQGASPKKDAQNGQVDPAMKMLADALGLK